MAVKTIFGPGVTSIDHPGPPTCQISPETHHRYLRCLEASASVTICAPSARTRIHASDADTRARSPTPSNESGASPAVAQRCTRPPPAGSPRQTYRHQWSVLCALPPPPPLPPLPRALPCVCIPSARMCIPTDAQHRAVTRRRRYACAPRPRATKAGRRLRRPTALRPPTVPEKMLPPLASPLRIPDSPVIAPPPLPPPLPLAATSSPARLARRRSPSVDPRLGQLPDPEQRTRALACTRPLHPPRVPEKMTPPISRSWRIAQRPLPPLPLGLHRVSHRLHRMCILSAQPHVDAGARTRPDLPSNEGTRVAQQRTHPLHPPAARSPKTTIPLRPASPQRRRPGTRATPYTPRKKGRPGPTHLPPARRTSPPTPVTKQTGAKRPKGDVSSCGGKGRATDSGKERMLSLAAGATTIELRPRSPPDLPPPFLSRSKNIKGGRYVHKWKPYGRDRDVYTGSKMVKPYFLSKEGIVEIGGAEETDVGAGRQGSLGSSIQQTSGIGFEVALEVGQAVYNGFWNCQKRLAPVAFARGAQPDLAFKREKSPEISVNSGTSGKVDSQRVRGSEECSITSLPQVWTEGKKNERAPSRVGVRSSLDFGDSGPVVDFDD
ncbi:hypothetical protein B0H16DRAFT_1464719 [Mycena metata]|uniref:Uncharacterized protein n=1 Tax=Mycena metata TaxID=1033252 RepID=A0AAD7IFZ4_9AGAR|nr:hypothetical protein B0H16DRAFT_1464719 [Mycena metata]